MSTAIEILEVLKSKNAKNPEWINKDLYRIFYKKDLFVLAYERIKSKAGNMTKGTTGENLDGISISWIDKTIQDFRNWRTLKFSPGIVTKIPKKNGKMRTLCVAPPREKVIQEAIRLILEAIYDPPEGTIFQSCSHGFRANKSCHTALKDIKYKWAGIKWFIEGDIVSFFDEIDHHILINLLRKKIEDEKFIGLMWKYLRAGYSEGNSVHKVANLSGTPQGGILSPLLSNIYLNEFDKYVIKLIHEHNVGKNRKINPRYSRLRYEIGREKDPRRIKELVKEWRKTPSTLSQDHSYIRIRYVRYADDWIIGINGSKNLASEIREKAESFLKEELKLKLNLEKTFIRYAKAEKATFLGIEISTNVNKENHLVVRGGKKVRLLSDCIQLNVNMDRLVKRLHDAGICDGLGFPTCRKSHINFDDWEIINTFNSILLGISNYYSFVNNRSQLGRVQYIIQYSAAKTLAGKHKTSLSKIFETYGKNLAVNYGKDKEVSIRMDIDWTKKSMNFKVSMWEKSAVIDGLRNKMRVTRSRLGSPCVLCGSVDRVQMHHVRHIRKSGVKYGGFYRYLGAINRKQVPLCKKHHVDVHNGKYDGKSLAQILDEIKLHKTS